MSTREIVAGNIRAEAARRGLTQSDIARRLGMAQSSISRRWGGSQSWTFELVDEVAAVLGLRPEDLLRARRDSNPQPSDPEATVTEHPAQEPLPIAA